MGFFAQDLFTTMELGLHDGMDHVCLCYYAILGACQSALKQQRLLNKPFVKVNDANKSRTFSLVCEQLRRRL